LFKEKKMSLFSWVFGLSDDSSSSTSLFSDTFGADGAQSLAINPASGLLMTGDIGGIDVGGNLWGCNSLDNLSCSAFDHGMSCGFDSTFSSF
jgi:hypothetical protein